MDGNEVRMRKHKMEEAIAVMLSEFQEDTGLTITGVSVDYARSMGGGIADVRLTMELE